MKLLIIDELGYVPLSPTGKVDEWAVHLRGGLNNGLTVMELQEMILQSVVYAGFPAAIQAISSLRKVVGELDEGIG